METARVEATPPGEASEAEYLVSFWQPITTGEILDITEWNITNARDFYEVADWAGMQDPTGRFWISTVAVVDNYRWVSRIAGYDPFASEPAAEQISRKVELERFEHEQKPTMPQ